MKKAFLASLLLCLSVLLIAGCTTTTSDTTTTTAASTSSTATPTTSTTTTTSGTKSWQVVGTAGINGTYDAWDAHIGFDTLNTPYVCFENGSAGDYSVTVKKYNGSSWADVGTVARGLDGLVNSGLYADQNLAFTMRNNIPYVAWRQNNLVTTAYYTAGSWVALGAPFSTGDVNQPALAFDRGSTTNPNIYCAAKQAQWPYQLSAASVDPASGSWSIIGLTNFSSQDASTPALAVSSGWVMVAFKDNNADGPNPGALSVMHYQSGSWAYLGRQFSATSVSHPCIFMEGGGELLVAYRDDTVGGGKAVVKKFVSGSWTSVGSMAATATGLADGWPHLYVSNATPYVVFNDSAQGGKATVMKFNSSVWEVVGTAGFSNTLGAGSYVTTRIAVDGSGVPYVAVIEQGTPNKLTVYKYN